MPEQTRANEIHAQAIDLRQRPAKIQMYTTHRRASDEAANRRHAEGIRVYRNRRAVPHRLGRSQGRFAPWSVDELCFTRDEAAEYCRLVKEWLQAPSLTRPFILRSLVGLWKKA